METFYSLTKIMHLKFRILELIQNLFKAQLSSESGQKYMLAVFKTEGNHIRLSLLKFFLFYYYFLILWCNCIWSSISLPPPKISNP